MSYNFGALYESAKSQIARPKTGVTNHRDHADVSKKTTTQTKQKTLREKK